MTIYIIPNRILQPQGALAPSPESTEMPPGMRGKGHPLLDLNLATTGHRVLDLSTPLWPTSVAVETSGRLLGTVYVLHYPVGADQMAFSLGPDGKALFALVERKRKLALAVSIQVVAALTGPCLTAGFTCKGAIVGPDRHGSGQHLVGFAFERIEDCWMSAREHFHVTAHWLRHPSLHSDLRLAG